MNHKQILISGIQPTNRLTLGNYLGAISHYLELQHQYQSYFFVADYHQLSVPFDPQTVKKNSEAIVRYYLACGIDPNCACIFRQSDVREHLVLTYLLAMHTSLGELNRMTQFKDKSEQVKLKNKTTMIPTGLLIYPVLMAADILLYDVNLVPVGQDQKQHIELTRNIALRLNKKYQTRLFTVPEEYIGPIASKVMDLQNPLVKMSKSALSEKGVIFLGDDLNVIRQKIMQAKTDSLNQIKYDPINQPGVSNLMEIYCAITKMSLEQYQSLMVNKNYGDLKKDVAAAVCDLIGQIQTKYEQISLNEVQAVLQKGANTCRLIAQKKVNQVQKILGLGGL